MQAGRNNSGPDDDDDQDDEEDDNEDVEVSGADNDGRKLVSGCC